MRCGSRTSRGVGTAGPPVTTRHQHDLLEPALPAVPGRSCRPATQRHLERPRLRSTPPTATASRWLPSRVPRPTADTGQPGATRRRRVTIAQHTASTHTIGLTNDQAEPWDYFPFNDRDFTSVAELMLVPGCPPGLFTKQFVELAPMPPSTNGDRRLRRPRSRFRQSSRPTRAPDSASPVHRYAGSDYRAAVAQRRGRVSRGGERHCRPAAYLPVPRG